MPWSSHPLRFDHPYNCWWTVQIMELIIHHHPDDGGSKNLWNVDQFLPDYTAQHPRRQPSSYIVLHWLNRAYSASTRRRASILSPTQCATVIEAWRAYCTVCPMFRKWVLSGTKSLLPTAWRHVNHYLKLKFVWKCKRNHEPLQFPCTVSGYCSTNYFNTVYKVL
jgi:hypothetical protein